MPPRSHQEIIVYTGAVPDSRVVAAPGLQTLAGMIE